MRKRLALVLALVQACSNAGTGASSPPNPRFTLRRARAAALAQVPGTVLAERLAPANGRWVYTFEIQAAEGAAVREVQVDPDDVSIVSVEHDVAAEAALPD